MITPPSNHRRKEITRTATIAITMTMSNMSPDIGTLPRRRRTTVPLLVLALCWISFLFSDEVNRARLLAAQQRARPPPPLHP